MKREKLPNIIDNNKQASTLAISTLPVSPESESNLLENLTKIIAEAKSSESPVRGEILAKPTLLKDELGNNFIAHTLSIRVTTFDSLKSTQKIEEGEK